MTRLFFKAMRILFVTLTLQRFVFLILFFNHWETQSIYELCKCILNGWRFDLMVTGYCLLPFLILCFPWAQRFVLAAGALKVLFLSLLGLCLLALNAIGFFDLQWFHLFSDRFSSKQSWEQFFDIWSVDGFLFLSLAGTAIVLFFGFHFMKNLKIAAPKPMKLKVWFLLVLVVALMIRGSIYEYHLDLRHANVTPSKFLNTACVPSPYALDQALRTRR